MYSVQNPPYFNITNPFTQLQNTVWNLQSSVNLLNNDVNFPARSVTYNSSTGVVYLAKDLLDGYIVRSGFTDNVNDSFDTAANIIAMLKSAVSSLSGNQTVINGTSFQVKIRNATAGTISLIGSVGVTVGGNAPQILANATCLLDILVTDQASLGAGHADALFISPASWTPPASLVDAVAKLQEQVAALELKPWTDFVKSIIVDYANTAPYPAPAGVQTGGTLFDLRLFSSYVEDFDGILATAFANPLDPAFNFVADEARVWHRSLANYRPILEPSDDPNGKMTLYFVLDLATGSDIAVPVEGTNYTEWITYLKPGCKFADGSEITSRNVQAGVSRFFSSSASLLIMLFVPGYLPPYFLALDGAEDYAANEVFFSNPIAGTSPQCYEYTPLPSVECVDDYTIKWYMASPTPLWNLYLRYPSFVPVIVEDSPTGSPPTASWIPENYNYNEFWQNPYCGSRNSCSAAYYYTGINGVSEGTLIYNGENFYDIFKVESLRNPYWSATTDPGRQAYPDVIEYTYACLPYYYTGPTEVAVKDAYEYTKLAWEADIYASSGPTSSTYYSTYINDDSNAEQFVATGTYGPASMVDFVNRTNLNKVWLSAQNKALPPYTNIVRGALDIFNRYLNFVVGTNGTYTATGAGLYPNVRRAVQCALDRGQYILAAGGNQIPELNNELIPSANQGFFMNSLLPFCYPSARDDQAEINIWKETDPYLYTPPAPADLAGAIQYLNLAAAEDGVTFPVRLNLLIPEGNVAAGTATGATLAGNFFRDTFYTGPLASYFTGALLYVPDGDYYSTLDDSDYTLQNIDLFSYGWSADYLNPYGYYQPALGGDNCTGGFGIANKGFINDPVIDGLLNTMEAQYANGQNAAGDATAIQIDDYVRDQAYSIPTRNGEDITVRGSGVNNFVVGVNVGQTFGSFWISPENQVPPTI